MLRHDDVVAYSNGSGEDGADADEAILSDDDVSHAVVDAGKIFDDAVVPNRKIPERGKIESAASPQDRSPASFMEEGVQEITYPPSWPSLARGDEKI